MGCRDVGKLRVPMLMLMLVLMLVNCATLKRDKTRTMALVQSSKRWDHFTGPKMPPSAL